MNARSCVQELSLDLKHHIRSEFTVDSISQCVLELIENSVDAGASKVSVRVDTLSWNIQVVDNGAGIAQDDLTIIGGRYTTSKCQLTKELWSAKWFGFRGEALASTIQVARTVEIVSRHRLSQQTFCKLFQAGKCVGVTTASAARSWPGTTVTVHGLFHNLPVRRRLVSAAQAEEQVKSRMQNTALALPEVAFSLHSEHSGQCLLEVDPAHSVLARFGQLYGGSMAPALRTVQLDQSEVRLTGMLSLHTHRNRSLQFIYINRRLTCCPELHLLVTGLMAPIVTQAHEAEVCGPSQARKRPSAQHPVYVIAAEVSDLNSDLSSSPTKTNVHFVCWERVRTAFTCLLAKFLSKNHFPLAHIDATNSPCPGRSVGKDLAPLQLERSVSWQQVGMRHTHTPPLQHSLHKAYSHQQMRYVPLSSVLVTAPQMASDTHTAAAPVMEAVHLSSPWEGRVAPHTHQPVYIHPVTGNTLCGTRYCKETSTLSDYSPPPPPLPPPAPSLSPPAASLPPSLPSHPHFLFSPPAKRLKLGTVACTTGQGSSSHSHNPVTISWENPTFTYGHQAVLSVTGTTSQRPQLLNQYKFTKTMLDTVKVLGQVDRKFVVCLLSSNTPDGHDLLVAIDQHAAHERVRLEALLQDLYDGQQQVKTSQIDPPLELSLSTSLQGVARLFRAQLKNIGVTLQVVHGRLFTSTLPAVLMEKDVGEKRRGRPAVAVVQLHNMVNQHLELLRVTGGVVSALPSSLADVLHSQACHGAIKFGDQLSHLECEDLVHTLSRCHLPFQCAHGRPSLAPLVDLDLLNRRFPALATHSPDLKVLKHRR